MLETHRLIHINHFYQTSSREAADGESAPRRLRQRHARHRHNREDLTSWQRRPMVTETAGPFIRALICESRISEAQAEAYYERQTSSHDEKYKDSYHVTHRHMNCSRQSPLLDMGVAVLRTCRQIYDEAKYLLYTTNTFSFRSSAALETFIRRLIEGSPTSLSAIRSLHLGMTICSHSSAVDWCNAIQLVVRNFKNLNHINLNLMLESGQYSDHKASHEFAIHGIPELKELSLRFATLIITEPDFSSVIVHGGEYLTFNHGSVAAMRERTTAIKEAILQPL